MPRGRRNAGTSLIEVLVVMVILLVGILAVIQIFPKGFQLLLLSRNASVATALSRDEIERLKSRPDQLPESIVSLYPDGTIDIGRSPFDLGAAFDTLLQNGSARLGSDTRGADWARFSGANATRHVIGEGVRVPAPRQIGAAGSTLAYGAPMILQYGPVDTLTGTGIRAYGNDLNVRFGDWNGIDDRGEYDSFLADPDSNPTLSVISGPTDRVYRVSFSAYAQIAGSPFLRRDFTGLTMLVPAGAAPADPNGPFPLYREPLSALLLANGVNGVTLGTVDKNSVRMQRQYESIPLTQAFTTDPYEFKIMSAETGVLLFNPYGYSTFVQRRDGKEALRARVDYDVLDWRVLREEFRFPYGLPAQHRLAVGSLKVSGQQGPDGRNLVGIPNLEGSDPATPPAVAATGNVRADHFVLLDLETGGLICEQPEGEPSTSTNPIVTLDKTSGLISIRDVDNDPSNGTTVHMRLVDGTFKTDVQIDNRALRAFYMVRNEYAVQVMKSPSLYNVTIGQPGYAQFYVGGSSSLGGARTRIYFPVSDAGRKVTIGEINYRMAAGAPLSQVLSQDFIVRTPAPSDLPLAYIDVTEALPFLSASQRASMFIDYLSTGSGARDVKAASVAVRTIWNPDFFTLTEDSATNMERLNRWGRGFRRSTNETYLEQGALLR